MPHRLALVLWNGDIGGAEVVNVALAAAMRRLGADVKVVFVDRPEPLAERLGAVGVPHLALSLGRGRGVLRHPRRYAAEVSRAGPDGALLVECGFMGAALRLGGFRGPIVGVEHGTLNLFPGFSRGRRAMRRLARFSGAWADDVEVAVSEWMLERMQSQPHARRLACIPNGIDTASFPEPAHPEARERPTVGYLGRLAEGKGADHLIRAFARVRQDSDAGMLIAGDGAQRATLGLLAEEQGVGADVEFLGTVDDVAAFWERCDVAVIPAAELDEAFSMATLEAMASGKAVIGTRNGAIPELIADGTSGTLVQRRDDMALTTALLAYLENPELRDRHGAAARSRAMRSFDIEDTGRAYLDLFAELSASRRQRRGVGMRSR